MAFCKTKNQNKIRNRRLNFESNAIVLVQSSRMQIQSKAIEMAIVRLMPFKCEPRTPHSFPPLSLFLSLTRVPNVFTNREGSNTMKIGCVSAKKKRTNQKRIRKEFEKKRKRKKEGDDEIKKESNHPYENINRDNFGRRIENVNVDERRNQLNFECEMTKIKRIKSRTRRKEKMKKWTVGAAQNTKWLPVWKETAR